MNKKMNFFRFYRRSLAALPVFLLFAACNHWGGLSPEAQKGSGKLVSVKIGAISIAGGAQNETVTRAGGDSRIVGEPIIQDLGGGVFAEISVEEDLSALRADPVLKPLGNGVKFRVIALKTNGTYYAHADFTVGGNSSYESSDLHVQLGVAYDFICISHNDGTLPDDADYVVGSALPDLVIDASKDLLYQKIRETISDVNSDVLLFNSLGHQLTKVQLVFDSTTSSLVMTKIAASKARINARSAIRLSTGNPAGSNVNLYFLGWPTGTVSSTEEKSDILTFFKTASPVLTIPANTVTLGTEKAPTSATTYDLSSLGKGKSYTVRLKIIRMVRFASSNIYWDLDRQKLTFKPYSSTPGTSYATEQQYQGVYFKWGSLVGISPAYTPDVSRYYDSYTIPIYVPTYVSSNPAASTWTKTTGSSMGWSWSAIPYVSPNLSAGPLQLTNMGSSEYGNFKGDICQYIGATDASLAGYRMVKRDEVVATDPVTETIPTLGWARVGGWGANEAGHSDTNAAGQYPMTSGMTFYPGGNFHPAAGARDDTGRLWYHGYRFCLWGCGAHDASNGINIDGNRSYVYSDKSPVTYGMAIRCVMR